jgi:methionine-rich copper-binding protein CopC
MKLRRAIGTLVTCMLLGKGAMLPGAALAHASLVGCNFAPGATLRLLPHTVRCTFAEGVNPRGSFIGLFQATGDHGEMDKGNSNISFTNAKQIELPAPSMPKGSYNLIWFTISADDGHRAGGVVPFSIR